MRVLSSAVLLAGVLAASPLAAQQTVTPPSPAAAPAQAAPLVPSQNQAQTPAPQQPGASPVDSDRYIIGQDDSIGVSVWKEPTLSGTFPVRPDGMITLALVGDIVAAGRTPMDLAHDLTVRLTKYITDPTVNVTVLAVNSKRVFMLGEIAHIGPLALTSTMNPLQAIAAAGGLSPYANKSHIYILRTEGGKQVKIPFDYKKAIKNGDQQGITLLPGDTIVVP